MSNRGRAVRVVGGRNVGCTGWINLDKPKPQQSYNVFLVLKNGTVAEKQVRDNNIEFEKKPNSYAEAIFQQHDDILLKMNQLVDAWPCACVKSRMSSPQWWQSLPKRWMQL